MAPSGSPSTCASRAIPTCRTLRPARVPRKARSYSRRASVNRPAASLVRACSRCPCGRVAPGGRAALHAVPQRRDCLAVARRREQREAFGRGGVAGDRGPGEAVVIRPTLANVVAGPGVADGAATAPQSAMRGPSTARRRPVHRAAEARNTPSQDFHGRASRRLEMPRQLRPAFPRPRARAQRSARGRPARGPARARCRAPGRHRRGARGRGIHASARGAGRVRRPGWPRAVRRGCAPPTPRESQSQSARELSIRAIASRRACVPESPGTAVAAASAATACENATFCARAGEAAESRMTTQAAVGSQVARMCGCAGILHSM